MQTVPNKKVRSAGFATVELLVTIVVIGLVFGAFITTFTTIQNINKKASDMQQANAVAYEKTQEYENKLYTDIPVSSTAFTLEEIEDFSNEIPSTVHAPRSAKVYANSITPTIKQIIVWVEYNSGSQKQTIQYSNLIQRNGIGR